jgi:hypothetical protein
VALDRQVLGAAAEEPLCRRRLGEGPEPVDRAPLRVGDLVRRDAGVPAGGRAVEGRVERLQRPRMSMAVTSRSTSRAGSSGGLGLEERRPAGPERVERLPDPRREAATVASATRVEVRQPREVSVGERGDVVHPGRYRRRRGGPEVAGRVRRLEAEQGD